MAIGERERERKKKKNCKLRGTKNETSLLHYII